jgi:exodeoxyribonuclease-5
MIELSGEQKEAIRQIASWFKNPFRTNNTFKLAGPAGSGKSSIAFEAIRSLGLSFSDVAIVAPTGKAAYVLIQKGNKSVSTIHSLIYITLKNIDTEIENLAVRINQEKEMLEEGQSDSHILALEEELLSLKTHKNSSVNNKKFLFKLKPALLINYKLILADEGSMIDAKVKTDLESFNIPILYLGDPFQLPPVTRVANEDSVFFDNAGKLLPVDFMLTEVHRQTLESPILATATKVRLDKSYIIPRGINRSKVNPEEFFARTSIDKLTDKQLELFDQIICGSNKTRISINKYMREVKGFTNPLPQKGDKIIFTMNSKKFNVVNGTQGVVENEFSQKRLESNIIYCDIRLDDGSLLEEAPLIIPSLLNDERSLETLPNYFYEDFLKAEYGYAITCHKSQGSQYRTGLIILEPIGNTSELKRRWTYTALTRFTEKVVVVDP